MSKPWDPKAAAHRSEVRRKEQEKAKQAEMLMDMAAGRVEVESPDGDEIDIDPDRPAGVWSTVRDEEANAGKERGGPGANPAAAGVSAMTEKKATADEAARQVGGSSSEQSDRDDEIVEPPPLDKRPFKVLRSEPIDYTPIPLNPKMHDVAIVGYKALEEAVVDDPVTWAWEGIVADNHNVDVSGPTTSGKTTFCNFVAVASASTVGPVKLFGHRVIPVPRNKRVLIIEEEDGIPDCRDKLRAACEMLGLDPEPTLNRIVILCRSGFHPGGELAEIVRADADRGCYGRIFLDSKARIFFEAKANSEEDQASVARWITELINRAGCSVWVISHTRKGRATELDDMSGNHQRAAVADVILLMTSKKAKIGRVLSSRIVFKKLRKMTRPKDYPKSLVFSIECDEKDRWQLTYKDLDDDELEAGPDAPLTDRIVSLLREDGGSFPLTRIKNALHAGPPKVKAAVAELVEKKILIEYTNGRCPLYKLRPDGHFDSFDELVEKDEDEDDEDE